MAYEVPVLILSFEADGDLSAKQFYAVKMSTGPKVAIISGATDVPIGILQNNPTDGKMAEVMVFGVSKVSSDAALTVGTVLAPQTDGQLEAADSGDYPIGQVIKASGAADEIATA